MELTVALTGALPAVIIVSAVLTAIVSVFLLWLYRRAVVRAMSGQAGIAAIPKQSDSPAIAGQSGVSPVLAIIDASSRPELASHGGAAYRQAKHSLNRSAGIYALGGLVYALVLTSAWMVTAGGGFIVLRFLLLLSYYSWPMVLAMGLLVPGNKVRIVTAYFATILVIACVTLFRNADLTVGQVAYLWLFVNGPGSLLLLAFLNRHVRAVGPLVLSFMVAAVTGAVIVVNIVGSSEGLMRGVAGAGFAIGLEATTIFVLLHLAGFALFGLLGWPLLRWLGRRYQDKKMSDQSISLAALWLLFGVLHSFTLVFENWMWIFTGPVAFVAYKLTVRCGFSVLAGQQRTDDPGSTLLLLRVFALGKKSQRLFDVISKVWLHSGSISLIAGPDLVTATVEPHEFLDFIGGRLSRQFVQGEKDLVQRVSHLDTKPDPDGRHRVNEFFCRADTWQMAMEQLAQRCDAVLMDLRSFSKSNRGCLYELSHLMNSIPLERVLLVIDDSTDQAFLEMTVREIWQNLEVTSPNAALSRPVVRCFAVKGHDPLEMEKLLLMLFGARAAVA
ncbi:MAG: hypothetical protein KKC76_01810 [Proteobacteria bacterium]|nr:hypothetical protein [Pseudomonadota bacterium]MBU4297196.1 hypothetical protein [Pseudomonadota bacterium]MCG2750089.1 hypothetical protein [Desulfobulbaceae bacterium]